jgi:hypothetical protein
MTARSTVTKGKHRNRGLLDLAKLIHECTNCGVYVVHGCEPAHENGIAAGKGFSTKGQDHRHAALCNACHAWYDQGSVGTDPSGLYHVTKYDKADMFNRAFKRTLDEYFSRGWLVVADDVPQPLRITR